MNKTLLSEKEKELLKKIKEGDKNAFCELALMYEQKLFSFACHLTKNEELAKDMVQNSLIKAYQSIKNFKGDCSFTTWFFKILNRTYIDELRKGYKKYEILIEDTKAQYSEELKNPAEIFENKLTNEKIQKAIAMLSNEDKTIILLRDFEELAYDEITGILNISEGTVKSRLSRARQKLRKILMEHFNF